MWCFTQIQIIFEEYWNRQSKRISCIKTMGFFVAFLLIFPVHSFVWAQVDYSLSDAPLSSACEYDYPPFCIVEEDGAVTGFSVELLRAAMAAMGREVSFQTGTWGHVRGLLERGEIDALPLVGRTPEREALFDFTVPYMSLYGAIVVRQDAQGIQDLADLKGRRVAVMKDDNAEEFLRREEREFEIYTTPTFEDAFRELSDGRCDAVVTQRLVALRLIQDTGLTNVRVVNRPLEEFRQDFCFAVTEGDRETLALLNEGLALVMADGTYRHLHAKWFASMELPTDRRIVFGGDYNYPPYEYLDENGRPAGYTVELTRAIARKMGIDIEIRLGPWSDIVEDLERGEIDAIQGMFYSPERDLKFDFSQVHMVNHYVTVVRKGEGPPPSSVEELRDKRIVVQKGDFIHEYLVENGFSSQITTVETHEDVLTALHEGNFDCGVMVRISAMYFIEKHGYTNLILGKQPLQTADYCYAVHPDQGALLAQLSEGLKILKESGEYQRIYEKWMGVYEERPITLLTALRYSALVIVPLIIIIAGSLLWSWSLRKQVARRTEELHESEEFQRVMIACSPMALYSVDMAGNVLSWNSSAERIFGWPADEVIGKPLPFVQEDKKDEFDALREEALHGGGFRGRELIRQRKDGSLVPLSISVAPLRNQEGKTIGIMSTTEDITDRKQAENELRESESRWRSYLESAPYGIFLADENGKYQQVNPAACHITGYDETELLSMSIPDLLAPESLEESFASFTELKKNGRSFVECPFITKTGMQRWWSVSAVKLSETQFLGFVEDVTEHKQAEKEIKDSATRWNNTFDAISDIVCVISKEHEFLEINASGLKLLNIPKEDIIGKKCYELIHGADSPIPICPCNAVLETHKPEFVEYEDNGRYYMLSAWPIESGSGKVLSFVHIIADITDKKTAEDERKQIQNQLVQVQKIETVGRLAGGVAHDFNNLLTIISGNSELALADITPDHALHHHLVEIQTTAKRASQITKQLLAFSRKQTVAPKVTNINELVASHLSMLKRLIGEDIEIITNFTPDLWNIKIDPTQIDQILMNFVVNARDAIDGVGSITIETENVTLDEAYQEKKMYALPGSYVLLIFSDSGAGMDAEIRDNVFEPFFTTKGQGKGTGLGLSTVYGIVKQNNGFINVYSEPGMGTTFKVYFPRYEGDTEEKIVPKKQDSITGNETVLVVEDDEMIIELAKRFLERYGYTVISCSTTTEAIQQAKDYPEAIHLLLTDVVMPEMNGKELQEQIIKLKPDIKTIFMSGYTANVIAHRGIIDKGVNFIQKPFRMKELVDKVREILDNTTEE